MTSKQPIEPKSKIVPFLWFAEEAVEAASFYASVFPESRVDSVTPLEADTPFGPPGSVQTVDLTLFGQPFIAMKAGPGFRFNPSMSFIVSFDPLRFGRPETREAEARRKLDEVWEKVCDGGRVLMPIDEYPFSERYGWVEDRYGLSWQLILGKPEADPRPAIMPALMFTGAQSGKAEEAVDFYLSVFARSERGSLFRYGTGQLPDREGTVMFSDFTLENRWFAAMDSAREHGLTFNEAMSLMVHCESQQEVDYYWEKLSAVPEAEACGWVKDRYGVSWQIVPTVLMEMLKDADRSRAKRVAEAMLRMKKIDVAALERAYAAPKALAAKAPEPIQRR